MTLKPLRVPVEEAARLLGISRPTMFRRIQRGEIAAIRDGRRTLILTAELERYAAVPSLPPSNPSGSDPRKFDAEALS